MSRILKSRVTGLWGKYMQIEKSLVYGVILSLFFSIGVAFAQANNQDILLGTDETKLLRLHEDAASVVIANPDYANVMVDTPRHLVVVPRRPGSTSFKVLNKNGEVITENKVIIGANKDHYVKIRRACSNAGDNACSPTSVYYCPNGCHEVYMASAEGRNNESAVPTTPANSDGAAVPAIPSPDQ